jgi:hypothetical protein
MSIAVVRLPLTRHQLRDYRLDDDLVKAVVDVGQRIMAIGGDLHADEEFTLLELGSRQSDLWGINLYLDDLTENWIEFDSMINLRPSQNNRSRGVEDPAVRAVVRSIVQELVVDA